MLEEERILADAACSLIEAEERSSRTMVHALIRCHDLGIEFY